MIEIKTLTDEDKLVSWHRVAYLLDGALGVTPAEFGYMPDELAVAWHDALTKATEEVALCEKAERSIEEIAKIANASFQSCITPLVVTPWEDILPEWRLKWKFLVRHVANMMQWDEEEEPIHVVEQNLVDWFKDELAKIPRDQP